MTVTYNEYFEDLRKFAEKHNKKADLKVYTSPLVDGVYHKEYCWSDGAVFYERNERVKESADVMVHGITVRVEYELMKTEYWSTEFGSKYTYDQIIH